MMKLPARSERRRLSGEAQYKHQVLLGTWMVWGESHGEKPKVGISIAEGKGTELKMFQDVPTRGLGWCLARNAEAKRLFCLT